MKFLCDAEKSLGRPWAETPNFYAFSGHLGVFWACFWSTRTPNLLELWMQSKAFGCIFCPKSKGKFTWTWKIPFGFFLITEILEGQFFFHKNLGAKHHWWFPKPSNNGFSWWKLEVRPPFCHKCIPLRCRKIQHNFGPETPIFWVFYVGHFGPYMSQLAWISNTLGKIALFLPKSTLTGSTDLWKGFSDKKIITNSAETLALILWKKFP